jgi:hypothetical protein
MFLRTADCGNTDSYWSLSLVLQHTVTERWNSWGLTKETSSNMRQ